MSLTVGIKLGSYEILAFIGAGWTGEVYRATDTEPLPRGCYQDSAAASLGGV